MTLPLTAFRIAVIGPRDVDGILNKALLGRYVDTDDLLQRLLPALRQKIDRKLELQTQVDRMLGEFPPNRALTVEVLASVRLQDGQQVPFVLILRNGRGEQLAIDTRVQDIQEVANWIAHSMGYAASPGISVQRMVADNARSVPEPH